MEKKPANANLFLPIFFAALIFIFFAGCTLPSFLQKQAPPSEAAQQGSGSQGQIPAQANAPAGNQTKIEITMNATNETNGANESAPALPNETDFIPLKPPSPAVNQTPNNSEPEKIQPISGFAIADPNEGKVFGNRCKVELAPDRAAPGSWITIKLYANSPQNERISYLCGSEERTQGYGGLFQDARLCYFDEPGLQSVWIALDGRICASAPLLIYTYVSNDTKICGVISQTAKDSLVAFSRNVSVGVYLANQDLNSNISWSCQSEKYSRKIGEILGANATSGVVTVGCYFAHDPGTLYYLPITLDSSICGSFVQP